MPLEVVQNQKICINGSDSGRLKWNRKPFPASASTVVILAGGSGWSHGGSVRGSLRVHLEPGMKYRVGVCNTP